MNDNGPAVCVGERGVGGGAGCWRRFGRVRRKVGRQCWWVVGGRWGLGWVRRSYGNADWLFELYYQPQL